MKHLLKILLYAVVVLCLASAIIVISAEAYLSRPEMIEKIRLTASRYIGARVRLEALEVQLTQGLDATAVSISSSPDSDNTFLDIEKIHFRYVPWRLLLREVDFRTIRLHRPSLHLQQNQDQEWEMPEPQDGSGPLTFDSGWITFDILLRDFLLDEGSVQVSTQEGDAIFKADGIRLDGQLQRVPSGITAGGRLGVDAFEFYRSLHLTGLQSTLLYENDRLTVSDLTARAYGSTATGGGELDLGLGGPTFRAQFDFREIQIRPFLLDLSGPEDLARGKLNLTCSIQGNLNHPDLLQGTGTFTMLEVEMNGSSLIQSIAEALAQPDLPSEVIPAIKAEFKIADRTFTLYRLEGKSEHLDFSVSGTVGAGRELDLDVLMVLCPEWSATLPEALRARRPPGKDGRASVTFKIRGTLNQPAPDLGPASPAPAAAP